jgi:hypothetical protein
VFYRSSSSTSSSFCLFVFVCCGAQYPFGESMARALLLPLEAALQTTKHTYCGRASHLFTQRLQRSARHSPPSHRQQR